MRGGERVLEALIARFPAADVFTLLHVPGSVSEVIENRVRATSFVQRVPLSARHYRAMLPLFPRAVERLDLRGYDLVISSSHCVAKGAITHGAPHLCYCHTPMRYVWTQYDTYVGRAGPLTRVAAPPIAERLRRWDARTADRVNLFVANSANVRDRIRAAYGRVAEVVYPPVDVARFRSASNRDAAYLYAGALVAYKRVDLAIAAFNASGRPLRIVGSGPEYKRLRRIARGNIQFTGHVDDREFADLLSRARGLIMPMEEDFGMVSVEAQAAGAPVVAFAAGGALETVVPGETGVFFPRQTPAALAAAVETCETLEFQTQALQAHAARFGVETFNAGMDAALEKLAGMNGASRAELVTAVP
jgi:glycosyltransferase involved in cell wall biosynthesis